MDVFTQQEKGHAVRAPISVSRQKKYCDYVKSFPREFILSTPRTHDTATGQHTHTFTHIYLYMHNAQCTEADITDKDKGAH